MGLCATVSAQSFCAGVRMPLTSLLCASSCITRARAGEWAEELLGCATAKEASAIDIVLSVHMRMHAVLACG